jgi:chlorobactene glucosyltransferase
LRQRSKKAANWTGGPLHLILSCIWFGTVLWLIVRAFNQRDLLPKLESAKPPPPDSAPRVAVVIPARDEAINIGRCLSSLVQQTYPTPRLHIIVVDDHSQDETFAIATTFAQICPQLTVLRSPALPPHWVGKSHACWIGARAAGQGIDWLCFMDADVWAEPALVASAMAAARSDGLDLLSLAPRQELRSFAERLVMPCGLYLLAFCQDLRAVQARHGSEVTATGQFMLVRRSCYEAVGGHAAVRGAICEDLMLARLLKRGGGHAILKDGRQLLSTRMYCGWSTLWIGIAKNLSEMLGGPLRTIAIAIAAIVLAWAAWLIPMGDAVACSRDNAVACFALIPGTLGSAAAFALHIAGASYFGIPPWYGLLFPLGYSAGALMAIDSVRRRLSGRVSWKGRTYP